MGRPCVLCRQRARWGTVCDRCRARHQYVYTPGERRRSDARPPGYTGPKVPTERLREALARSGDDAKDVAARIGWSPSRLREALGSSWVMETTAERLCDALHVAPVEVGL